jgi:hypothetical protein
MGEEMKAIKITKNMLKNPAVLLKKVGAVYENDAFPSYVYMNKSDYLKLKKNLIKAFKKEYPHAVKRKIQASVEMILLNLGPVNLKKGIEKGYLLVDDKAINNQIEFLKFKQELK